MIKSWLILLATVSLFGTPPDIDLESMAQSFVLEAKQLSIPQFPTACNPSIVRWQDRLLLSFDAYCNNLNEPDGIGLVYLDDDFNVIGTPELLNVPSNLWQDPRLITLEGRLFIVFNGAIDEGVRRMFVSQVNETNSHFTLSAPQPLLHFPDEKKGQWERNWIPFAYKNTLLLTYSLSPHRILQPLLGTHTCEEIAKTPLSCIWQWGTPKPGTAALLDGDHYLAFFHSQKIMASLHSNGQPIPHYFIGAYTFLNQPPFALTSISHTPIIGNHFYHVPSYRMVKPCQVVFPCGFVMDNHFLWIVFGRQDHELWLAKLDKEGLYKSLMPVAYP